MKTKEEILTQIESLKNQKKNLVLYLDEVSRKREDWHGIQDAGSDIREIDSEIKALRWIISE